MPFLLIQAGHFLGGGDISLFKRDVDPDYKAI